MGKNGKIFILAGDFYPFEQFKFLKNPNFEEAVIPPNLKNDKFSKKTFKNLAFFSIKIFKFFACCHFLSFYDHFLIYGIFAKKIARGCREGCYSLLMGRCLGSPET